MSISLPETIEQRLFQLIISRLNGDDIHDASYRRELFGLVEKGIGGFILFGGERDETAKFIQQLQSLSAVPLFIASDIERGAAQQIKGATPLPCPMAIAAALDRNRRDDTLLLGSVLAGLAEEAIVNGINMPLVPVMDVNREPDNPIICTRAFSDDPRTVSWFGSEYIRALERAGLISCAKHFPGHGDTSVDSHIALPVIRKSAEDLRDVDLVPFIGAVRAGTSSIMVGHLAVPCLDNVPATFSRRIMHDLLRQEIGFDGLVLTDALDMNALGSTQDSPVKCMNAGADILLHPADAAAAARRLLAAVESGEVTEGTVNAAVGRIIKAKERLVKFGTGLRQSASGCDYDRHMGLSSTIVDRSITIVKNAPGLLPLNQGSDVRFIVAGDTGLSSDAKWAQAPFLTPEMRPVPISSMEPANAFLLENKTALFAIFTSVAAWKGNSGISGDERDRITALIKRAGKSVVVSFGSPYVLRYFGKADILIAAYEPTYQAQEAVIKCLSGGRDFMGRLPVKLNISNNV